MSQTGGDGGSSQTEASDGRGGPANSLLVHRLAVRQICLDTCDTLACVRGVDVDADLTVEIGDRVRDSFKSISKARRPP